jgi:hypothetical protein
MALSDRIRIIINESGFNKKTFAKSINLTDRLKLTNHSYYFINVAGDWVYYRNKSDDQKLYKIRTDGTNRQLVE